MKKIIYFTFCLLFLTSFQYLQAQWARTYGEGLPRYIKRCIQQTNDGGYVVLGEKGSDFWILKLDIDGDIQWQRSYGQGRAVTAYSIQQTSDEGYIVAGDILSLVGTSDDCWIVKLDSDGDIEWQRIYGGNGIDTAYAVQQTSDGGYIVAGETWSLGANPYDFWILKLELDGDIEWQRTYGQSGSGIDRAYSIQQTSDGGYIVTGEASSDIGVLKLDSNGDIEWQKTYGGDGWEEAYSIQQTSDGGYIVAGETSSFSAGDEDFLVLKLDSNGDIEWQRMFGGSESDSCHSIQQTSDGGYIAAGETESFGAGLTDFWVLKLDPNGNIEWQRTYGGSDYDEAYSVQEVSDEVYLVAGEADSFGGILVLKLYSDGDIDPSCEYLIGDSNAQSFYSAASSIDTNISPVDTNVSPLDTAVSPQVTNKISGLLCGTSKYILSVSKTTGGSTEPLPGTYPFDYGAEESVEALPESGYEFSHWSGDRLQ